jgi:translation initiation factor IF-2
MLVGEHYGRIKALYDYTGKRITEAGRRRPVAVSGLMVFRRAGEQFRVVDSENGRRLIDEAREAARVTPTGRAVVTLDSSRPAAGGESRRST